MLYLRCFEGCLRSEGWVLEILLGYSGCLGGGGGISFGMDKNFIGDVKNVLQSR